MRRSLSIAACLCLLTGAASAQNPQPSQTVPTPVQPGNPPVPNVTIPPHAGANPIPAEVKVPPGTRGSDASGLAPIREVPPPVPASVEASNLRPASGTISSNPAGLPITPNPAISSITPYLFHGYGYPAVGYYMPYGYRRSFYGSLRPVGDFGRMRRLARLMNDLDNLIPGVAPAPARVAELRDHLNAVVYAKDRPAPQFVAKLANDLAGTIPSRNVPMLNTGQLAADLERVVNAGAESPAQLQDAIESVRRELWHSGVSDRGILLIVADLRTLTSGDIAARPSDKPITYIP